jgi:hypothetical protein
MNEQRVRAECLSISKMTEGQDPSSIEQFHRGDADPDMGAGAFRYSLASVLMKPCVVVVFGGGVPHTLQCIVEITASA